MDWVTFSSGRVSGDEVLTLGVVWKWPRLFQIFVRIVGAPWCDNSCFMLPFTEKIRVIPSQQPNKLDGF